MIIKKKEFEILLFEKCPFDICKFNAHFKKLKLQWEKLV